MNEARDIKLTNSDLTLIEQALGEKYQRLVKKFSKKIKGQREREQLATWQTLVQYISRVRYEADQGKIETQRKDQLDRQEEARIRHNLLVEMKTKSIREHNCVLCGMEVIADSL